MQCICVCVLIDKMQLTFTNWRAELVCIALVARWTNTSGPMDAHLTDCIDTALVLIHAGVLALLLDTGQLDGAVAVDGALWLALGVGIALQA